MCWVLKISLDPFPIGRRVLLSLFFLGTVAPVEPFVLSPLYSTPKYPQRCLCVHSSSQEGTLSLSLQRGSWGSEEQPGWLKTSL